jgi:hypothetical protein
MDVRRPAHVLVFTPANQSLCTGELRCAQPNGRRRRRARPNTPRVCLDNPLTYGVAGSAAAESPACPRACVERVRVPEW